MKRRILSISLVLLLAISLATISCGPKEGVEQQAKDPYEEYVAGLPGGSFPVSPECFGQAMDEGELLIYEWPDWWPEEVYEGFSEEFGIKITRDAYATAAEVRTKFALAPETPFDLVCAMGIEDVISLSKVGAAGTINPDWAPNVWKYIPGKYLELAPKYSSVAYHLFFTAYMYNTKYVDDPRIPSWGVLLEPEEQFKGKITLLDDEFMVVGSALKYLGYSFYSDNGEELIEAEELLMKLKPYVMEYSTWPLALIREDEALIVHMWSGDGWFLHDEYEPIMPVLPSEGADLGVGLIFHPVGSPNPAAAHLFVNYLFRPEVNAFLIEKIFYPPTHTAVLGLLPKELLPVVTVPEGYSDKCDPFDPRGVTGEGLRIRTKIWEELKS